MLKLFTILSLLAYSELFGQTLFTESSLLIRPKFKKLTEVKYHVNRKYDISHPSGYPLEIYSKLVEFYLQKTVIQVTMKLSNE